MLAAIKSGGLVDYLIDWPDIVGHLVEDLEFWKAEIPDLSPGIDVLQQLRGQVRRLEEDD